MNTENLSTLKINKLSNEQYRRELESGNIDEFALYLTPEEDYMLNVPVYASDEGKFLRVVNGVWAAATVPNAEEASF